MQAASTKSGINWKKWLVYGATALVAVTVGYYSYKACYTPQLPIKTATLTKVEVREAEETLLAAIQEARIGELTTTENLNLFNLSIKEEKVLLTDQGKLLTAEDLGIVADKLKELSLPAEFEFDADQLKEFYRNSDVIKNVELTAAHKTTAKDEALDAKQVKVDEGNLTLVAENHANRNQAIRVAAVPTLAVGAGGYWGYNKWCSKMDDKPVDQKPVDQKPAGQKPALPRVNVRNARTPYSTAGDRNNTKTDGSKIPVEGGDDTKTNKADKKSGMPGWAIFLIIFAIVAVIGAAVVYFVFFTSKDEDEEFDNEL